LYPGKGKKYFINNLKQNNDNYESDVATHIEQKIAVPVYYERDNRQADKSGAYGEQDAAQDQKHKFLGGFLFFDMFIFYGTKQKYDKKQHRKKKQDQGGVDDVVAPVFIIQKRKYKKTPDRHDTIYRHGFCENNKNNGCVFQFIPHIYSAYLWEKYQVYRLMKTAAP
jgi:hypothetical protein